MSDVLSLRVINILLKKRYMIVRTTWPDEVDAIMNAQTHPELPLIQKKKQVLDTSVQYKENEFLFSA